MLVAIRVPGRDADDDRRRPDPILDVGDRRARRGDGCGLACHALVVCILRAAVGDGDGWWVMLGNFGQ